MASSKNKNPVRRTTAWVMARSRWVSIDEEILRLVARRFARRTFRVPTWPTNLHFPTTDERRLLTYLIILDSLNFCFWSKKKKWRIIYRGKAVDGYFALSLALRRFFEQHPDRTGLLSFATMSWAEFQTMLHGEGELLFLKERWRILRSVSRHLIRSFQADPRIMVDQAQGFVSRLVPVLAKLPSFNDQAAYRGRRIVFRKRAQILVSDIWGAFRGRGVGRFHDLEYLTAFADYKVPQILHHLGVLRYTPELRNRIARRALIPKGSRMEVEMRAATVQAIERIQTALAAQGKDLRAFEIDWILWNESQRLKMKMPYHLTKTVFY